MGPRAARCENQRCESYHRVLINVQLAHPSVRIVAFADDSAFNDAPAALYPAFVTKCEIQRDLLGLEENMTKIIAFSNGGDMRLAPPYIPGAAGHRDGVVGGAKIAGCFHGDPEWVAAQLEAHMEKKIAPVDRLVDLCDTLTVHHTLQMKQRGLRDCLSNNAAFFMGNHTPSLSTAAATLHQTRQAGCSASRRASARRG